MEEAEERWRRQRRGVEGVREYESERTEDD